MRPPVTLAGYGKIYGSGRTFFRCRIEKMEVRLQHRHLFPTVKPKKERSNTKIEFKLEMFEKQRTSGLTVGDFSKSQLTLAFKGCENPPYRATSERHTDSAG